MSKKIDVISDKFEAATAKISKNMFERNIQILHNFENVNFADFKPKAKLKYLSKPKNISILKLKGIPIQILPHHVFTFEEKGIKKIGAIWFVSKLGGYSVQEIAMFTDALYRYLKLNYSKDYEIVSDYCLAVDVVSLNQVTYTQISGKAILSDLPNTLDSISKILN